MGWSGRRNAKDSQSETSTEGYYNYLNAFSTSKSAFTKSHSWLDCQLFTEAVSLIATWCADMSKWKCLSPCFEKLHLQTSANVQNILLNMQAHARSFFSDHFDNPKSLLHSLQNWIICRHFILKDQIVFLLPSMWSSQLWNTLLPLELRSVPSQLAFHWRLQKKIFHLVFLP